MRLYLPTAGTLGCTGWPGAGIAQTFFMPPNFYLPHMNLGLLGLLASTTTTLPCLSTLAPHLHPSYLFDEYGFFKSWVVGLPYSSIFWKFWAFFVLRLLVILLVVVQGGKACLLTPPS